MASNRENNEHAITRMEIQLYQGPSENNAHAITGMEIQLYQGPSDEQNVTLEPKTPNEEQQNSSRKRRFLTTSKVIETTEVFFRVFRFSQDDEKYLLEMHHVQTDYIDRYLLVLEKNKKDDKKFCVDISDLDTGRYVVFPMTEDSSRPKFFKKYPLSLQERLERWTLERRIRISNNKEETFYRHSSKTLRSLVGVAGFILYSCEPKDLHPTDQEEQVAEDFRNSLRVRIDS